MKSISEIISTSALWVSLRFYIAPDRNLVKNVVEGMGSNWLWLASLHFILAKHRWPKSTFYTKMRKRRKNNWNRANNIKKNYLVTPERCNGFYVWNSDRSQSVSIVTQSKSRTSSSFIMIENIQSEDVHKS